MFIAHTAVEQDCKKLSLTIPHNKFVEAYVWEDAEHACESESEGEYAVAFRMKILRSITNAS